MGDIPFHLLPNRRVPEHLQPSQPHFLQRTPVQLILAQIQAEGGADSHEYHAVLYERKEPGGQEILFRRSQGSPDNPGSGIRDPFRNSLQIIFLQRSEWRRIHAGDGASLQNCLFLHRFERFFSIAQEKLRDTGFQQGREQVQSDHAFDRETPGLSAPNQRRPIRNVQERMLHHVQIRGIPVRRDHRPHVRHAHIALLPRRDGSEDPVSCIGDGSDMDGNLPDPVGLRLCQGSWDGLSGTSGNGSQDNR